MFILSGSQAHQFNINAERRPRDYLLEFALHSSHIPAKYPAVSWNAVLQLAGRRRYRANNGHFVYVTAAADEKQMDC
jgi:hypothetical protein